MTRKDYAQAQIAANNFVICVCGQMFDDPDKYVEHFDACPIVERGGTQANVDFQRD